MNRGYYRPKRRHITWDSGTDPEYVFQERGATAPALIPLKGINVKNTFLQESLI